MSEEPKIEPYYQSEAKRIVDMLFDAKLFKDKVTRDHLNTIEDLLAYLLQSNAESTRKCVELLAQLKK